MGNEQIIVFIDPDKFWGLTEIDINNHQVGYCNYNGNLEVNLPDLHKIETAAMVIIPDHNNIEYKPLVPFKILYHTGTPQEKINNLIKEIKCEGYDQEREEKTSLHYSKIVSFLNKKEGVSFEDIYSEIKGRNKLDIALEFLCSGGKKEDLEKLQVLDNFEEIQNLFNEWKNGEEHTTLPLNLCRAVTKTVIS